MANNLTCLLFSADEITDLALGTDYRATVNAEGYITWNIYGKFVTRCPVDLTFLPFDTQVCNIELINVMMSMGQLPKIAIVVNESEVEVGLFKKNSAWELSRHFVSIKFSLSNTSDKISNNVL